MINTELHEKIKEITKSLYELSNELEKLEKATRHKGDLAKGQIKIVVWNKDWEMDCPFMIVDSNGFNLHELMDINMCLQEDFEWSDFRYDGYEIIMSAEFFNKENESYWKCKVISVNLTKKIKKPISQTTERW